MEPKLSNFVYAVPQKKANSCDSLDRKQKKIYKVVVRKTLTK